MKTILVISLLAIPHAACSQAPSYPGAVVDNNGKVWVGKFQVVKDVVVLSKSQGAEVFPAWRTREVRGYDSLRNLNRRWISHASISGEPRYYEMVVEGKIRVVRRSHGDTSARDVDYDYFYIDDGVLIPLMKFRDQLYKKIRVSTGDDLLNPNEPSDAIRYIQRYNQTFRSVGTSTAH